MMQSKLASLRNANSEDEIDDSLLQLGLLAYPVLQAADVLLYKSVDSLELRPCASLMDSSQNDSCSRRTRSSSASRISEGSRSVVQSDLSWYTEGRQGQGEGYLPDTGSNAQYELAFPAQILR